MTALTAKTARAIEAVLLIADRRGQAINSKELAALLNCAERFLEPLMQKLVREKILTSQRGPGGGYVLGRERRRISLHDILSALEPESEGLEFASDVGKVALAPVFARLKASRMESLRGITLDQLAIARKPRAEDSDFII